MQELETVLRGGTVVTASDQYRADVGIAGGRIVAIADSLRGASEVDAGGLLVLPGGVDSHVHIEQPGSDGSMTADDFETGTRSAACGGTTTIIPFAVQEKGKGLRASVDAYRRRGEGRAWIDFAIHLIVSDPSEAVVGQELADIEDVHGAGGPGQQVRAGERGRCSGEGVAGPQDDAVACIESAHQGR